MTTYIVHLQNQPRGNARLGDFEERDVRALRRLLFGDPVASTEVPLTEDMHQALMDWLSFRLDPIRLSTVREMIKGFSNVTLRVNQGVIPPPTETDSEADPLVVDEQAFVTVFGDLVSARQILGSRLIFRSWRDVGIHIKTALEFPSRVAGRLTPSRSD